jgi:hypothetical protein
MATNISSWRSRILRNVSKCPVSIIDETVLDILRDFCEHTKIWTEQLTVIELVAYTSEYALTSANGDIVGITHAEIDNAAILPISERILDDKDSGWRDKTAVTPTHYLMDHDRTIRLVYMPNEDSTAHFTLSDLTFDATANTIASTAGGFTTNGLTSGHTVTVSGTTSNDRNFKITAATDVLLTVEGGVTDEGTADASATFTVKGLAVWVALKPTLDATTVEDFIYEDYLEVIADGARGMLFGMAGQPWANGELATYYTKRYQAYRNRAANRKRLGLTGATSGASA